MREGWGQGERKKEGWRDSLDFEYNVSSICYNKVIIAIRLKVFELIMKEFANIIALPHLRSI